MTERSLEGKVALVTGGSRGIGLAISRRLADRGANVVIAYLRNRRAAEEACADIEGRGVKAVAIRAHVGEADDVEAIFSQIDEVFGRLDIFVSNAATGVIKPFEELSDKAWQWTMDSNARALFLGARHALALMHDGGVIVALSSEGARRVLPGYSVVGTSKAAIEALVRYLGVELAAHSIRVNAVSPGVVDTDALRHFPMREEMLATARADTPAGRIVEPDDVAAVVDFLVSDRSSMITGQSLVVDGGAGLLA
ncbi:MAG: enoyl-[acyl-carrier-protein] reductase FabL [Actinomycetota bacterium]